MSKRRIRSRQCICDHEEQCRGMSLAFQMLEDPRGGHVEVPQAATKPEYEFFHRMNELRKAYFRQLSSEPQHKLARKDHHQYVALHHFHPQVVHKLAEAAGGALLQVPPTFQLEDTARLGWEPTEADRVYDVNGKRTEDFYFAPNYPIEFAHRDLKQLSKAERSNEISRDVYENAKKAIQARKEGKHKTSKREKRREKRRGSESKAASPSALARIPERSEPRATAKLEIQDTEQVGSKPITDESADRPTDFQVIGAPEDICRDPGGSSAIRDHAQAALNASESTLNGSFNIFSADEIRRRNAASANQAPLDLGGDSDTTALQVSSNPLGDSTTTVLYGASSSNFQSSAVSLQIADPALMEASHGNMFHASDHTVRASGGNNNKFNQPETTIDILNISATENSNSNLQEQKLDFPLEEEPKRKNTFTPSLETAEEEDGKPPPLHKPKSITELKLQSSSAALEFPLEELPRRRREPLPSCETMNEATKRNSSAEHETTIANVVETAVESPPITVDEEKDNAPGSSRFSSTPAGFQVNDSSPLTPRRIRSKRAINAKKDDLGTKAIMEKTDHAPSSPRRKQAMLDLEIVNELPIGLISLGSAALNPVVPLKSQHDITAAAPPRRGSMGSKLSLLDKRKRRFFERYLESSKENPLARSLSGESIGRRRFSGPGRSKSDSLGGVRRSSDTILLGRGTNSRRIDTTFRALQHYSNHGVDRDGDGTFIERPNLRRIRSRSESPTRMRSCERRQAIVASDGDALLRGRAGRRNRRTLRRTKSAESRSRSSADLSDSSLDLSHGTRSNDSSAAPSSRGPKRGVRRTKSHDAPTGRISRKTRMQLKSRRSLDDNSSPCRAPLGRTKSGLSPKIRRIDTSNRAMKQFVMDSGFSIPDLSADHSPRRTPVNSRNRRAAKRSGHHHSPLRRTTGRNATSDRNSSPAVMGDNRELRRQMARNETLERSSSPAVLGQNRARLHASMDDLDFELVNEQIHHTRQCEMSASSPAVMAEITIRRGVSTASDCPPKTSVESAKSEKSSAVLGNGSNEASCMTASSASNSNRAPPEGSDSALIEAETRPSEKACLQQSVNDPRPSITVEQLEELKTDPLSENLPVYDPNAAEGSVRTTDTPAMLEDFHFSYPLPIKSGRPKAVDWESLGFYSSGTPRPKEIDTEEETEPSTFAFPLRLVGKKVRQELLAEVVMTAHRRRSVAVQKQNAMRREPQLIEMLAAVKEVAATKAGFSEEVARSAEVLLEVDRAGRKASLQTSQEKEMSLVSLDLDNVFEASQELVSSPTPRRSLVSQQESPALNESTVSLSLRRVFERSGHGEDHLQNSEDISDLEKSGCMKAEQLRAVFPFKTLKERKRSPTRSNGGSFHSPNTSTWIEEAPVPSERLESQSGAHLTTNVNVWEQDRGSSSGLLCVEKLPNISEEDAEIASDAVQEAETSLKKERKAATGANIQTSATEEESGMPALEPLLPDSPDEVVEDKGVTRGQFEQIELDESIVSYELPAPVYRSATTARGFRLVSSSSSGESLETPMAEFHLSFPPALATRSRALPAAFTCLGRKFEPKRRRNPTTSTNGGSKLWNSYS